MADEIRLHVDFEGFTEGTVVEWLKQVGDAVASGDGLVEIEGDKSNVVVAADRDGVLIGVAAEPSATVLPGDLVGWIGDAGEPPPSGDPAPPTETIEALQPVAAPPVAAAAPVAPAPAAPIAPPAPVVLLPDAGGAVERIKSSPVARRVARALGVDLATVTGTGPGGRVIKVDVETAAARTRTDDTPGSAVGTADANVPTRVPLTRLQSTVARRMVESKTTVPHFYLRMQVDMTAAVAARRALKQDADGDPVPSFNDFVVKAAALTLTAHPKLNGAYVDGEWHLYPRVDVGIAVATDDGLVVPVIRGADRLGLAAIGTEARRLAGAANAGQLGPQDLDGGTFTISNLGMYGVTGFDAVVNPPQAAILSVGAIQETVIVRDGQITPGSVLELGLSCDHRIVYGADGAAFLDDLRRRLENPVRLAL